MTDTKDLVRRLRENANPSTSKWSDCIDLCREAADAIERLSAPAEPTMRELTPDEHDVLDAALRKSVKVVAHPAAPAPDPYFLGLAHTLLAALKRLSFAAQTACGTAGRDDGLVAAIGQAESAIKEAHGRTPAAPAPDVVPLAEYRKLQKLVTNLGIRLMDAEDDEPAPNAEIAAWMICEPGCKYGPTFGTENAAWSALTKAPPGSELVELVRRKE